MDRLSQTIIGRDVDLNNYQRAFGHKSEKELKLTQIIFRLLQYNFVVQLLSVSAIAAIKLKLPVSWIFRTTVFKIFCAGESIDETAVTIKQLQKNHVGAVLDYVSEGEISDEAFDLNHRIIYRNISLLSKTAAGNAISVKLTGLEDSSFFRRINDIAAPRTEEYEKRYQRFLARLDSICEAASKHGVIVYFDAEDRFMQDIFDHAVEMMMKKYNRERAVVYNTLQMYLKDRLKYLEGLLTRAEKLQYYPGVKLVRGAYVEKERETAIKEGRPSPVFDTKSETDHSFNRALVICLSRSERVYTCIASHNKESTALALRLIKENLIHDHSQKVKFSQLYGMSDVLTFNLAESGFNASKYLPYGEVGKAIPYLIRRAEENSSISVQIPEELKQIRYELQRRTLRREKL
jgi:proline dehydrogenase